MPQIFQVLRCFKCSVFQVHQTKKSNKFNCKMCGEKQSIKRHYGLGTGKECRQHVQKLNGIRGEIDDTKEKFNMDEESSEDEKPTLQDLKNTRKLNSKWKNFVDEEEHQLEPEDNSMFLGNAEVVLEVPVKRKRFSKPKASKEQNTTNYNDVNDCDKDKSYGNIENYHVEKEIVPISKFIAPQIDSCSSIKTNVSKVISKFVPPEIDKNSKWAQFTATDEVNGDLEESYEDEQENNLSLLNESNDDMPIEEIPKRQLDTIETPINNKSSRWHEYTEYTEDNCSDNYGSPASKNIDYIDKEVNEVNNIFATCEESELDDILNI